MTTAPDPRYPGESHHKTYEDVLVEVFDYANLTLEAQCEFLHEMDIAVGWELADRMQATREVLNGPEESESPPAPKISGEEHRAALRRRQVVVNTLLLVAVITLLSSLYTMALGHEALAWFGLAGCLGLCWMAHRAEEGK